MSDWIFRVNRRALLVLTTRLNNHAKILVFRETRDGRNLINLCFLKVKVKLKVLQNLRYLRKVQDLKRPQRQLVVIGSDYYIDRSNIVVRYKNK